MDRVTRRRKNGSIKKFGINVNQYQMILEEQNHKCFICNEKENRALAIDHCHTSGKVRGLLCSNCNRGLGMFLDDPQLLQNAVKYLQRDYIVPEAKDFDEYIEHNKRARWKVQVITPDSTFNSIAAAAKYYNVHETTIHGWLGKLKKLHLKKDGWEYKKVFTSN